MLKAIIFDLDGTIGDTLPLCIAAFKKSIEPLSGREFSEEEIIATFGPTEEGTIQALIPDFYEEGLSAFLRHYKEMHDMCPSPFAEIKDIITWLKSKGIIVAMVTGKGLDSCMSTLDHYEMNDLFEIIETGSPHGPRKAEGIQSILNHFHLAPEEAMYVGDALSDIIYAKKVHVPIVSAAWASTAQPDKLQELNPDALFTSIEEFHIYLKNCLKQ